ncbi:MAG: hypothetical protein IJN35_06530 [Muribaculaceae bacterium]|nr:hypothetical protein [Muribaculaceae bacterium]
MKKGILQVLKLILAFAGGGAIGLIIALLFTGTSVNEFLSKLTRVDWVETAGAGLFSVLCAFVAMAIHTIIHEAGHLIAGLISGYKFLLFRIGSLTLIHSDGKYQLKRFPLEGTGGQCLMIPPQLPIESIPTKLYNLGGVLINILCSALAIIISLTSNNVWVTIAFLLFALIGLVFAALNGIPMKLGGVSNDGKNVQFLDKDTLSKKAFINQLMIHAITQQGTRPRDIPDEYLTFSTDIDFKDALQVNWLLMSAVTLMDRREYEASYRILDTIIQHESEVLGLFVKETKCELVFASLITGRIDRATERYSDEIASYAQQYHKTMSNKLRLLCATALYIENNPEKAHLLQEQIIANRNKYLMQGEVVMDIDLIEEILSNKIQQ